MQNFHVYPSEGKAEDVDTRYRLGSRPIIDSGAGRPRSDNLANAIRRLYQIELLPHIRRVQVTAAGSLFVNPDVRDAIVLSKNAVSLAVTNIIIIGQMPIKSLELNAPGRIRTCNRSVKSRKLYQLSYECLNEPGRSRTGNRDLRRYAVNHIPPLPGRAQRQMFGSGRCR